MVALALLGALSKHYHLALELWGRILHVCWIICLLSCCLSESKFCFFLNYLNFTLYKFNKYATYFPNRKLPEQKRPDLNLSLRCITRGSSCLDVGQHSGHGCSFWPGPTSRITQLDLRRPVDIRDLYHEVKQNVPSDPSKITRWVDQGDVMPVKVNSIQMQMPP